jgi:hypothetical protein
MIFYHSFCQHGAEHASSVGFETTWTSLVTACISSVDRRLVTARACLTAEAVALPVVHSYTRARPRSVYWSLPEPDYC